MLDNLLYLQAQKSQNAAKAGKATGPPVDISAYLKKTGILETRYVRLLASLCSQTYLIKALTVSCPIAGAVDPPSVCSPL